MTSLPQELWIALAGHAVSALLMLAGGVFVLAKDWRRTENRLFFFMTASTFVYEACYVIAALQTSYGSAYFWWSLNIVDVLIPMTATHFILRISGRDHTWRWFIRLTYALGFLILLVARVMPGWFLPDVIPKLYFPYYLDGGWWYGVMLVYFLVIPAIAAANLVGVYRKSFGIERQRLEYFL